MSSKIDNWKTYLDKFVVDRNLPVIKMLFIGDGIASLSAYANTVVDIVAERHKLGDELAIPTFRREILIIGTNPEHSGAGGAAYFSQDGALNSGFADLMMLPDRKFLEANYPGLDYAPLLELFDSLQDIANGFLEGALDDLVFDYGIRNQPGANMLAQAIEDGHVDTTKASLLRRTVGAIFAKSKEKLEEFVSSFVPEIEFSELFETEAVGCEWTSQQKFRVKTRAVGPSGDNGTHEAHIVLEVSGTRTRPLVSAEVAEHACVGPANALRLRENIRQHGNWNKDGSLVEGTTTVIIGQELHGYDCMNVASTVLGANKATGDSNRPWTADPDFASKTHARIQMMSRTEAMLPPPRLSHTTIWEGDAPMLTTMDLAALPLVKYYNVLDFKAVWDGAIAHALKTTPSKLPIDNTSEERLRRFGDEIERHEAGKLTHTFLHEKLSVAHQFQEVPSIDPPQAEKDAAAEFPSTFRPKSNRYNSRYSYITGAYLDDHPSNADAIEWEKFQYLTFASAPLETVRNMVEHQKNGVLQFVSGDANRITYDAAAKCFRTDAGDADIVFAPPIITNDLSPAMLSLYPDLKKDQHGQIEYLPGRQVMHKSGTPIPFFDYGNNSNGNSFPDSTGRSSVRGKWVCDVATLFTNFMGLKSGASAWMQANARLIAHGSTYAAGTVQELYAKTKPPEDEYRWEAKKALYKVRNMQELGYYLRLIAELETFEDWDAAYLQARTSKSRGELMSTWLSGTDTQKEIAGRFFAGYKNIPKVPECKTLDEWWKEDIDTRLSGARKVLLSVQKHSAAVQMGRAG
jgi:hypothetical protein